MKLTLRSTGAAREWRMEGLAALIILALAVWILVTVINANVRVYEADSSLRTNAQVRGFMLEQQKNQFPGMRRLDESQK